MTGWRKRQVVDMAREASDPDKVDPWRDGFWILTQEELERFAELVRADEAERIKQANAPEIERINSHIKSLEDAVKAEAEKYKYDIHSCGPTCTKVGCVAVRKAVEAEREACAKVCEEVGEESDSFTRDILRSTATAIRARSNT